MFKAVPHEQTEWGAIFAVVDKNGRIVALDRWYLAEARAEELNRVVRRPRAIP